MVNQASCAFDAHKSRGSAGTDAAARGPSVLSLSPTQRQQRGASSYLDAQKQRTQVGVGSIYDLRGNVNVNFLCSRNYGIHTSGWLLSLVGVCLAFKNSKIFSFGRYSSKAKIKVTNYLYHIIFNLVAQEKSLFVPLLYDKMATHPIFFRE